MNKNDILNYMEYLEEKWTEIYGVPIVEMYADMWDDLRDYLIKEVI